MKTLHTPAALCLLAAAMLTSSCSLLSSLTGPKTAEGTATASTGTAAAATGTTVSTTTVKPDKNKNKKDKKSTEQQTSAARNVKPTQEELCGGQWTVASVGDVTIDAEDDAPYVAFDNAGRFYASDGCNIINGDYALRSDGVLSLANTLSTMKYCPEVEYSPAIAAILNGSTRITADCRRIGQETYLYLKNERGNTVMTLRRHNMEFLNGNWQVTSVDGKKIDDEEANIFIDIAELKVHGNTGCNFFNGELYIDPQRSNAIDFSNMGVTRMACPKQDQERAMLVALEETASAVAGKNGDTVLLFNKTGRELLTLKRIAMTPEEDE